MTTHHTFGAALIAAASLLATASHAEEGFHLELAVGSSKYKVGSESLPDSATAVGITGRHTWPSGFGIEGGVRAHGEWAYNAGPFTLRPNATSYLVGATYDLPLGPVTLGARLGAHTWRVSGRVIDGSSNPVARFEDSGGGLYYSLGASVGITERLSIGAYHNVFRMEEDFEIKSLDVRLSYRF